MFENLSNVIICDLFIKNLTLKKEILLKNLNYIWFGTLCFIPTSMIIIVISKGLLIKKETVLKKILNHILISGKLKFKN